VAGVVRTRIAGGPTQVTAGAASSGSLLGGRVRYAQPRDGFRSGVEPVLLAAAVPTQPGERVLEGGSGAGAALLCLAARVPGIHGLGVELDSNLVALATANASASDAEGVSFVAADLVTLNQSGVFDHAMANPPYHAAAGTTSPHPARELAKRSQPGLLREWTAALVAPLRHRGTLTLILPAASLPEALDAMRAAGCGPTAVLPLWPTAGRGAKLVLLRGMKGGRAPMRLLPGLVLHTNSGGFTPETEAVLRDGAAIQL
jgi:tRNA1Val (adenine37-N6)-methyltransferase